MTDMAGRSEKRFQLTGRHVLLGFCGFFGFILFTNTIMIYLAVSTFPGLQSKSAYKAGRDYNQQIEAARTQTDLGWTGAVTLDDGDTSQIVFTANFADKYANPVTGLKVTGVLRRTVHEDQDIPLTFEALGQGVYRTRLDRQAVEGQWFLRLKAEDGFDNLFRVEQKVYVKP